MLTTDTHFSLNFHGRLVEYRRPVVMGILNVTPDSFYAASRVATARAIAARVEAMITEGVDIIDVGACSTRPGATPADAAEELARLEAALPVVREIDTAIPVSVDTFRASVARHAVEELGADMVNDVSGLADPLMADTVASLHVPYVLTHSTPLPDSLDDASAGVIAALSRSYDELRLRGVCDIIIDPGLGFGKSLEQNYRLVRDLPAFAKAFPSPLLVGASRKSMLTRLLGISPDEALGATVAIDTAALMLGASILRVHDVAEARRTVTIVEQLRK